MAFCELHYFSEALGRQTAANVLIPDVGEPPFPVLYLLHGLSDDHTMWLRRSNIERHAADLPLIVVMPDGGRGFYTDAAIGQKFQTALAVELPRRIERTFPARTDRDGRCVAGLSMGGYGALRFALTFPDRYAAAVCLSGAVNFGHLAEWKSEHPMSEEFQRILGPAPLGGPGDLWSLVETVAPEALPALRIDCGVEDFLIEDNRAFHAHLDRIGIPHEYVENPGAHNWDYWDLHVQSALAFCRNAVGL